MFYLLFEKWIYLEPQIVGEQKCHVLALSRGASTCNWNGRIRTSVDAMAVTKTMQCSSAVKNLKNNYSITFN